MRHPCCLACFLSQTEVLADMTASSWSRTVEQIPCMSCSRHETLCSSIHVLQFDSLALGCLKVGRGEEAEQLFDERDYL